MIAALWPELGSGHGEGEGSHRLPLAELFFVLEFSATMGTLPVSGIMLRYGP